MTHTEQTCFEIKRFEPVDHIIINIAEPDASLVSLALLAIERAGGQARQIFSIAGSTVQSLSAVVPAGCGGAVARRLRSKVHRFAGSTVHLEPDRSEVAVAVPGAPLYAARCIWALEDRGVRPTACWAGERGFGLVVPRALSATAAALCFRLLAEPPATASASQP